MIWDIKRGEELILFETPHPPFLHQKTALNDT